MPLLDAPETLAASICCIREMRIAVSIERLPRVRWFYEDLLGLPAWPAAAQMPGGWGVGPPRAGLHFQYRHDPEVDAHRRRCTLFVRSLELAERLLLERDWRYERRHDFGVGSGWLELLDPIGHRLELRPAQAI